MQLIAMHHLSKALRFIEGSNEQYQCIVYWRLNEDFIRISDSCSFNYDKSTRVPKFTNPFRRQ